jgi:hypothetical protein
VSCQNPCVSWEIARTTRARDRVDVGHRTRRARRPASGHDRGGEAHDRAGGRACRRTRTARARRRRPPRRACTGRKRPYTSASLPRMRPGQNRPGARAEHPSETGCFRPLAGDISQSPDRRIRNPWFRMWSSTLPINTEDTPPAPRLRETQQLSPPIRPRLRRIRPRICPIRPCPCPIRPISVFVVVSGSCGTKTPALL